MADSLSLDQSENPASIDFWEERYQARRTGWDIGRPAPAFEDLLMHYADLTPGSMIALGCGRGHDAIFFAKRGFNVIGVDFAPTAIDDAQAAAAIERVNVEFIEQDVFTLDASHDHRFNYVLEHTCFVAILPERRPEYVQLVKRLLRHDGIYIALFFSPGNEGGPPFNVTTEEIRELFSPHFTIERLEPPERSVEQRQGQEIFALMRPLHVHNGK